MKIFLFLIFFCILKQGMTQEENNGDNQELKDDGLKEYFDEETLQGLEDN